MKKSYSAEKTSLACVRIRYALAGIIVSIKPVYAISMHFACLANYQSNRQLGIARYQVLINYQKLACMVYVASPFPTAMVQRLLTVYSYLGNRSAERLFFVVVVSPTAVFFLPWRFSLCQEDHMETTVYLYVCECVHLCSD